MGAIDKFIFEFNYVHHTRTGHHVKSRARFNRIAYNYLTDHDKGSSSFAIDLEDGGDAIIIGNVIHKSKYSENSAMIHYGMPNSKSGKPFYVINNTASSNRGNGIFVLNHSPAKGLIVNNLLVGKIETSVGKSTVENNIFTTMSCFSQRPDILYSLNPECKAVNAGQILKNAGGINLVPGFEYIHPISKKNRVNTLKIDIGAYESEGL